MELIVSQSVKNKNGGDGAPRPANSERRGGRIRNMRNWPEPLPVPALRKDLRKLSNRILSWTAQALSDSGPVAGRCTIFHEMHAAGYNLVTFYLSLMAFKLSDGANHSWTMRMKRCGSSRKSASA